MLDVPHYYNNAFEITPFPSLKELLIWLKDNNLILKDIIIPLPFLSAKDEVLYLASNDDDVRIIGAANHEKEKSRLQKWTQEKKDAHGVINNIKVFFGYYPKINVLRLSDLENVEVKDTNQAINNSEKIIIPGASHYFITYKKTKNSSPGKAFYNIYYGKGGSVEKTLEAVKKSADTTASMDIVEGEIMEKLSTAIYKDPDHLGITEGAITITKGKKVFYYFFQEDKANLEFQKLKDALLKKDKNEAKMEQIEVKTYKKINHHSLKRFFAWLKATASCAVMLTISLAVIKLLALSALVSIPIGVVLSIVILINYIRTINKIPEKIPEDTEWLETKFEDPNKINYFPNLIKTLQKCLNFFKAFFYIFNSKITMDDPVIPNTNNNIKISTEFPTNNTLSPLSPNTVKENGSVENLKSSDQTNFEVINKVDKQESNTIRQFIRNLFGFFKLKEGNKDEALKHNNNELIQKIDNNI